MNFSEKLHSYLTGETIIPRANRTREYVCVVIEFTPSGTFGRFTVKCVGYFTFCLVYTKLQVAGVRLRTKKLQIKRLTFETDKKKLGIIWNWRKIGSMIWLRKRRIVFKMTFQFLSQHQIRFLHYIIFIFNPFVLL